MEGDGHRSNASTSRSRLSEEVVFSTITLWIRQGTNTEEELFIESKKDFFIKTFSRLQTDKNPVDNQPGSLIRMEGTPTPADVYSPCSDPSGSSSFLIT